MAGLITSFQSYKREAGISEVRPDPRAKAIAGAQAVMTMDKVQSS